MNPGLFGIPSSALVGASGSNKVRVRAPFTVDESTKNAVRLQTLGQHPLSKAVTINLSAALYPYILAASPTTVVALGTTSSAAATTVAGSSTDGIFWSTRTVTSGIYSDCVWTGTIFFAITTATSATQTSTDGATWSVGTVRPNTAASKLRVFNGKVYIFPNSGTTYYASTNLNCTAWTTLTAPTNYAAPTDITVSGSRIVISTSATAGASSADGSTWSTWSIPALAGASTNRFLVANSTTCALFAYPSTGNTSAIHFFNSFDGGLTFNQTAKILDCSSVIPNNNTSGVANGAESTGPASAGTTNFSISRVCTKGASGERVALVIQASHNSGIRAHLVHSVDCENWIVETQHADTASNADGDIVAFQGGFVLTYGVNRTNAASPSGSGIVTNSGFKELVYDL